MLLWFVMLSSFNTTSRSTALEQNKKQRRATTQTTRQATQSKTKQHKAKQRNAKQHRAEQRKAKQSKDMRNRLTEQGRQMIGEIISLFGTPALLHLSQRAPHGRMEDVVGRVIDSSIYPFID